MNLHAIFHRSKSNYCYCYDNKKIHIRLRAARNDLDKVFIIYGDKFLWDKRQKVEMDIIASDNLYDYYGIEVEPEYRRLAYMFEIVKDDEAVFYTEWGALKHIDEKVVFLHFFQYPYIHESDIHNIPEWTKEAIFYQIFVDRFYNNNSDINQSKIEKWGVKPKPASFYGGDLCGIIKKLDYLKDLGINAIYLTPIFQSPSNHKYDITDYFKIDSNFGDVDTLKELVQSCHKRGIKVVLDAVFNHCGKEFEPFQDVLKNGKSSKYYNWFYFNDLPIKLNPPSYDAFAFVSSMPKLNTQNEEVREYLLKVARYWIEEVDIDGWRLDVADEVDHDFWREFRKTVKKAKKDAFIIGELWLHSLPWLMGDQFDTIMNYPFTRICIQYFSEEKITTKQFKEYINKIQMDNLQQVTESMFNLLDSHDTPRFLTFSKGDKKRLKLAAAFQLTYTGTPCIYYGTEIGIEGDGDPDCRRTMEWDNNNWDIDLRNFYKKLISVRKQFPALQKGSFRWINSKNDNIAYIREIDKDKVVIVINNNDEDIEECIEVIGDFAIDAFSNERIEVVGGKCRFRMNTKSMRVLSIITSK